MIEELELHFHLARQSLDEMRVICTATNPDIARLAVARLQLIKVSVARSKYIQTVVCPALTGLGDAGLSARLRELYRDLADKRVRSSRHIARWSVEAIKADWSGYRAASAAVARGIEARANLEKAILLPALRSLAERPPLPRCA